MKPRRNIARRTTKNAPRWKILRTAWRQCGDERDGEMVQNVVYEVGKAHGFEPLRAWFAALYEVLFGQTQVRVSARSPLCSAAPKPRR